MKKKIAVMFLLLVTLCTACVMAWGESTSCPRCDRHATYTGQVERDGVRVFLVYKCMAGHYFLVRRD